MLLDIIQVKAIVRYLNWGDHRRQGIWARPFFAVICQLYLKQAAEKKQYNKWKTTFLRYVHVFLVNILVVPLWQSSGTWCHNKLLLLNHSTTEKYWS